MEESYDVIVVGAGPTGASAAKVLVESGLKTLVVEQKALPRNKSCAGMYSPRACDFITKHFGPIPDSFFHDVKTIGITISKRGKYSVPLPVSYSSLKREEVDYWLVKESGAEVIDSCTVKEVSQSDGVVSIKCSGGRAFSAKYLIAADGGGSVIRRAITDYTPRNNTYTVQHIYEGDFSQLDSKDYNMIRNKKFAGAGGFAWWQVKDGRLYIGSNHPFQQPWIDYFFELYNLKGELVSKEGSYINNFFFDESNCFFGKGNILIAGEAAGLMGTAGEGVPAALYSGRYAGEAVIAKGNVLDTYLKLVNQEVDILKEEWSKFK